MKYYWAKEYPEHDRTSCNDTNLANVDPDGSGCRRCNALLFNRYEELLEEVQALRKDAGRYQWLKKYADPLKGPAISTPEDGNHWLNGRIDGFIDAAMEQQT